MAELGKTIGNGDVNESIVSEDGVTDSYADIMLEAGQSTVADISERIMVNSDKIDKAL